MLRHSPPTIVFLFSERLFKGTIMRVHFIRTATAAASVAVLLALGACSKKPDVASASANVQEAQQTAPEKVQEAQLSAKKDVVQAKQQAIQDEDQARAQAQSDVQNAKTNLQQARQNEQHAQQQLQQAEAQAPQKVEHAQQQGQEQVQQAQQDVQTKVQNERKKAAQDVQQARANLRHAQQAQQSQQGAGVQSNGQAAAGNKNASNSLSANDTHSMGSSPSPNALTDGEITAKVKTGLSLDKQLSSSGINVDTQGGVVTLTGSAPSQAAKTYAGKLASNVTGVTSVDNELRVQ
jgi:hyperosmotically inducible periplasmic protein